MGTPIKSDVIHALLKSLLIQDWESNSCLKKCMSYMVEGSCEIPHGQEVISHIKALPLSMCITSTELWSYSIAERDVDVKDSDSINPEQPVIL